MHFLEHSNTFFYVHVFVGFTNEKQAHLKITHLKLIFGDFSILGAQTTTMVTDALMAQPKGFICTCALIFIVYFFVCFLQNNVESRFKLKVLWRTQTFSHEIHIRNLLLKYSSWLEQTNNLIGKLNRYLKKYQTFRFIISAKLFFRKRRSKHRRP